VAAEVPSKAAVPAAKAAAPAAPAVSAASETAAPAADALLGLPAAETRTAKDNDMARNFMINSINSIIGQQMRVSLIHDIFHAGSTEALRTVYHAWAASMAGHGMGSKRLPELREKLFKVL
jgi:3-oxoacyl-ACP reductase-like protein